MGLLFDAISAEPSPDEARAYSRLGAQALKQAALQNPPQLQVTRVEQARKPFAFLVRSPEPIDWKRASLVIKRADRLLPQPHPPGSVKITDVSFITDVRSGAAQPNQESVTLLLREATNLTGHRIEHRQFPAPVLELDEADALLLDRFASGDMSDWVFIDDEGTLEGPSSWGIFEGSLQQKGNIYSPPIDRDTLSKRGTHALAGDSGWTDVMISVRLQSFDDDAIGLLFRYSDANHYYRFSMDRERGYRRLVSNVGGAFTKLWEDRFIYQQGRSYEFTVTAVGKTLHGYFDGAPLFVVEDDKLPAGRIGLYCWGNTDARFSQVQVYPASVVFKDWLLEDPFDTLIPGRWTFVAEGDKDGPMKWEVTDGEMRQTSNIHGEGSDFSAVSQTGTYALAGDVAWTDYRTSVQLRSDADGVIGVMFRYQDAGNYYRFSMDRGGGLRQLIRKKAGASIELWRDNIQYDANREYLLTLDCVGEQLTGYLDGVHLFTIEDNGLSSGRIGLYCSKNPGARFGDVRVAEPAWTSYYTFADEERLPAGTQVRVYAGSPADPQPERPGIIQRFLAPLGEHGRLRFHPAGADLRLRSANGIIGHTKRFLHDDDYNQVSSFRLLRKADGTAFFIVIPAVSTPRSQLPMGEYRLRLTYRRNNKETDPASQIFSQAGDSEDEKVTIDIPWKTR